MAGEFFIIFAATIAATRLYLFIKPTPGPTIGGLRLHHWMFGAVGIPIALWFGSIPLYAVSLGLFVDELTYLLMGGKTHEDNYSKISLLGTLLLVVIVFFLRDYLVATFVI
ncbi:MAG: hypothetical protein AAB919_02735 [Patescibacteria group bacterium]